MLPTDSHKNRVYALAKELGAVEPEDFALALAAFFVASQEAITRARISVEEFGWTPIGATGYSFARSGDLVRTTTVVHDATAGTSVVSGIKDLIVLNTTGSEFWGFPKDAHTTLAETKDRMLATAVNASWRFRPEAAATVRLGRGGRDREEDDPRHVRGHVHVLATADALRARLGPALGAARDLRGRGWRCRTSTISSSTSTPFGLENDREVYLRRRPPLRPHRGQRASRRRPATPASPGPDQARP